MTRLQPGPIYGPLSKKTHFILGATEQCTVDVDSVQRRGPGFQGQPMDQRWTKMDNDEQPMDTEKVDSAVEGLSFVPELSWSRHGGGQWQYMRMAMANPS